MKGILFTEFIELIEAKYGLSVVDAVLESSDLPSQGIYTAVGEYDSGEMVRIIYGLSQKENISIDALYECLGVSLFNSLIYEGVINNYNNSTDLLLSFDNHIAFYVDLGIGSKSPTLTILDNNSKAMTIRYSASGGLYRLAYALIEKTFLYFKEKVRINYELLDKAGSEVKFDVVKIK